MLLSEVLMSIFKARYCCVSKWWVVGAYITYPDTSCQLFGHYPFL